MFNLLATLCRSSSIKMSAGENKMLTQMETTCGTLLNELQVEELPLSSFSLHFFFSHDRNILLLMFMCPSVR